MIMTARGGAMAAMGYLPDQLAADNKPPDRKSLSPVNHDCQHMNFLDRQRRPGMFSKYRIGFKGNKKKNRDQTQLS